MQGKAQRLIEICSAHLYPRIRLLGIELWLTSKDDETVCIEAIWSHDVRHAGRGGLAMRKLCELADDVGVALVATVHPLACGELDGESAEDAQRCAALDQQAFTAQALTAWYERLGFSKVEGADPWNPEMRRKFKSGASRP